MLTTTALRTLLQRVITDKHRQGHETEGLDVELSGLGDSYDALVAFAERLAHLPMRSDWPYVEPVAWEDVVAESHAQRKTTPQAPPPSIASRIETAFLASVCGCVLGKPVEVNPTLDELESALRAIGDWPLDDYISTRLAAHFPRPLHNSWNRSCRETITAATWDDDINYTVMGMLVLEQYGPSFTHRDLRHLWLSHLPPYITYGPERVFLIKAAAASLLDFKHPEPEWWQHALMPNDEHCGALIRADAYGYACAGDPARAAELAFRDASLTHRRTGVYSTMFIAAAVAQMPVVSDPLDAVEEALRHVPQKSRFHTIAADSLEQVRQARDWRDGYNRIHGKYKQYTHCCVYQEVGTLFNTLRFATSIGDGICKQVMQGNDTDSFGATAGSLLGMWFGPGHLDPRWLAPFGDRINLALAMFHEQSLSTLAKRMAKLPEVLARPRP